MTNMPLVPGMRPGTGRYAGRAFEVRRDALTTVSSSIPVLAEASSTRGGQRLTLIRPLGGMQSLDLPGLWHYRDLLWSLTARDIKVRYKQTLLGAAWAVLQPVLTMIVLSAVLGPLLGQAADHPGVAYPIFLYTGLLPWSFFAAAVGNAAGSFISNAGMIQKVYFPRLILPLATLGTALVDFAIAGTVLGGMMVWYHTPLSMAWLLVPLPLAVMVLAAAGVGIWVATLSVTYRDVRYVVPFALQLGLFLTPVILPSQRLPGILRGLVWANPMSGPVETLRAIALGTPLPLAELAASAAVALLCLMGGLVWYGRSVRRFADVV